MDNKKPPAETFEQLWQRSIPPPQHWPMNGQTIPFEQLHDNLRPRAPTR